MNPAIVNGVVMKLLRPISSQDESTLFNKVQFFVGVSSEDFICSTYLGEYQKRPALTAEIEFLDS